MKKLPHPINVKQEVLGPGLGEATVGDNINNGGATGLLALFQDTKTSDELIKLGEEKDVITWLKHEGWLSNKIHGTIMAIDSELNMAVDWQYRELLVKAAYQLRNLEESIQRAICWQECGNFNR